MFASRCAPQVYTDSLCMLHHVHMHIQHHIWRISHAQVGARAAGTHERRGQETGKDCGSTAAAAATAGGGAGGGRGAAERAGVHQARDAAHVGGGVVAGYPAAAAA
eukprot:1158243-Pelagomonas_calceolata.AAC.11